MKKILLSVFALAVMGIAAKVQAQCDPNIPIKKWTVAPVPGIVAPIIIDGNANDWQTHIVGTFSGNHATPYNAPVAAGNIQIDGANSPVDNDRDNPGQVQRDLTYFGFTYDQKNAFFYYHRLDNAPSQVLFIYYIDINADGYMRTGEPVLAVGFNGPNANINMHYYTANTLAVGYDAVKGNPMTNPNPGPGFGLADGYSMPGTISAAQTTPTLAAGELFTAAETETGFGGEIAVPFNFLRLYGAGNTGILPMTYQRIFTWHTSLNNGGNFGSIEDNAGGCCSGLAASGSADVSVIPPSSLVAASTLGTNTVYTAKVKYQENAGASTNIRMSTVAFTNITQNPPGAVDPTTFSVTVYKDANSDGVADDAGTVFAYSAVLSVNPGEYIYFNPAGSIIPVAANGTASFITVVNTNAIGVKSFTLTTTTTDEITGTNASTCGSANTTSETQQMLNIVTTLPVSFKSFTATRSNANVMVKWETSTEVNNSGFAVERNVNGTWIQVAFVPSQAAGGNSNSLLAYSFNDLNSSKGVSQYRIKQIDIDAQFKYSEVRSVRGDGQASKIIVYPNPSSDGKVNVVFEDAKVTREVSVMDMSGRLVKQFKGVTNNNISIENLTPGIYTLRVFVPATGEQAVQKIVVSKQ